MSREKIVLIDGHSILTRAFFGVPDLTNAAGQHTNAVYGFLNIMFKILEEEKPDKLLVAFDLKAPTFRHNMFEGYKGTRKPMPAELHEQVPLIRNVLTSMHIPILTMEGYEADDILGTMAKKGENQGYDVVIVSGDRDLLQLATDTVLISIPKTKQGGTEIENYYAADVQALYGVNPKTFIDMKGLMGDTADNIPGVKGIGEKTAGKLLQEFGSIEEIYAHIDEVKPPRIQNLLREGEESAKISKTLATICVDVPLEVDFSAYSLADMYNPESYKQIKMLGFQSMTRRFSGDIAETAAEFEPLKHLTVIESEEELEQWKASVLKDDEIQTIGYADVFADTMMTGCVCIATDRQVWMAKESEQISKDSLKELLPWLQNTGKMICLFDLKQKLKYLSMKKEDGMLYDCMVCAYLLNPLQDGYGYDYVMNHYFGIQLESEVELRGKTALEQVYFSDWETCKKILAFQASVAAKAGPVLKEHLETTGMEELYEKIEYPLIYVLDSMEKEGVLINELALKQYSEELSVGISKLEQEIYAETGEEFNINSPKQLGVVLFEKMGLKGGKKTKTGYSTSAEVLEKLAADTPVVHKVLEYRQLTKLKSTYADGLRNYIDYDGRIHGTFNQTITATGRISSTDPNLQNIPIRMEMGRKIREVFIPKPGYQFVDADYSQIELRILAHMSGDEHLIEAYNSEQDIHKITASKVFHVPLEEVTPQLRRNAKAVNFGIVYGISSFGLSQDLSIGRKEAGEYIKQYFETYPKVKEFLDRTVEEAKRDGYTVTIYGRRRPIPELKSSNFMQRSFGERAAMNSAVQGTAADIMKLAMIHVYNRLQKEHLTSRLILQVHDEILIETAEDEVEQVKKLVFEEMSNAADLAVKLEVGIECGSNWLEAH